MGKYMRKAKITGDVAVMEVSSQSSLGVRTRAKTLALQRLQSTTTANPPPQPATNTESAFSYLELRSRRLEKPPLLKQQQQSSPKDPNLCRNPNQGTGSRLRLCSGNSGSVGSVSIRKAEGTTEDNFGENNLELESRERGTRESTPCSLIRDSKTIETPGSSTRPRSAAASNRRVQNATLRNIPTTQDIEEFFSFAEQQQQHLFAEKYNFDVVNDMPLQGRYEWVRMYS